MASKRPSMAKDTKSSDAKPSDNKPSDSKTVVGTHMPSGEGEQEYYYELRNRNVKKQDEIKQDSVSTDEGPGPSASAPPEIFSDTLHGERDELLLLPPTSDEQSGSKGSRFCSMDEEEKGELILDTVRDVAEALKRSAGTRDGVSDTIIGPSDFTGSSRDRESAESWLEFFYRYI